MYIGFFCQHLLHLLHQIVISLRSTNAQIIQHISSEKYIFLSLQFDLYSYWILEDIGHFYHCCSIMSVSSSMFIIPLFSHEATSYYLIIYTVRKNIVRDRRQEIFEIMNRYLFIHYTDAQICFSVSFRSFYIQLNIPALILQN